MGSTLLTFLDLVPEKALDFLILEVNLRSDIRWETPFTNHHKMRFDTKDEIQKFLTAPINSDVRVLSLTSKYTDKSFIYYDIIAQKVKIYNSVELMNPKILSEKGLLGPDSYITYFEIVF